ncbi:zinc-dependent metalloprotease [Nocardioides limicola]|uniref:zinc-dependent metalloprotease n=1 Tax=Nocardioides limicola TaxID=2803368 RepID=UPI00193AFEA6|nr:zinc-dependent metalloprotease [Nocardioides sp. DJM-14]
MSDFPGDPDDRNNPFKGTPFEQLFSGLGGAAGAGGFDLSAIFGQLQAMMKPHDGPVNWEFVTDTARRAVAQQPDPSPSQREKDSVADALGLADHWLDEVTDFSTGVTSTAAWSRAEWVVNTVDVWQGLVEPIAASAIDAMGSAVPEEAQTMAGPLIGMMRQGISMMVGTQVGTGLGALAGEVLSASDVGLPLGPQGQAALLPANLATFADGLDVSADDVRLYLALREAAHQRLFHNVGWLREHLLTAITDYAGGINIDTSGIEAQLTQMDLSNPQSLQDALEGGLFDLARSPAQEAALQRIEVTLALIEGWVDEVVSQATADRMPAASKLAEAVRRRRAAGGPAEETFAALVGLELRPRRLRDAATLWGSLRARQGSEARDGVWLHPHLLPTAADLDDPLGFREGASAPAELDEDAFEAGLRELLDGPDTDQ